MRIDDATKIDTSKQTESPTVKVEVKVTIDGKTTSIPETKNEDDIVYRGRL